MQCEHKPKEVFRAAFRSDDMLTCWKCGREVLHKHDSWENRIQTAIVTALALLFSWLAKMLAELFLPESAIGIVWIAAFVLFDLLGLLIYAAVFDDYIAAEEYDS